MSYRQERALRRCLLLNPGDAGGGCQQAGAALGQCFPQVQASGEFGAPCSRPAMTHQLQAICSPSQGQLSRQFQSVRPVVAKLAIVCTFRPALCRGHHAWAHLSPPPLGAFVARIACIVRVSHPARMRTFVPLGRSVVLPRQEIRAACRGFTLLPLAASTFISGGPRHVQPLVDPDRCEALPWASTTLVATGPTSRLTACCAREQGLNSP